MHENDSSALRRHVAAIADLGRAGVSDAELPVLLDDACTLLADALEVDFVGVLEDTPEALVLRAGFGCPQGYDGGAGTPRDASLAGYVLRREELVILEDATQETRFKLSPLFEREQITSGVCLPVAGLTRPYGVLGVFTQAKRDFSDDDCTFLRLVANTLGAAIESREAAANIARYRDLFQLTNDMIFILDGDERYVDVNPAVERILGYAREDVVGSTRETVMAPDAIHEAAERFARKAAGMETSASYETALVASDGRRVPAQTSSQVILRDGKPAGVIAIVRDISEQVAARAALIEGERRFRSAFDDAAVGMMLTQPDGRIERVNAALARMLGYFPVELAGMTIFDITHREDIEASRGQIAAIRDGERDTLVTEKRYVRQDGDLVDAHVAVSAVRDDDGQVQYFVSQIEDVTEFNRVRSELDKTQQMHRAVIENSRDLITVTDTHGVIRLVSGSVVDILGYERDVLVGERLHMFIHPDDLADVESVVGDALEGRTAATTGARVRASDGSYRVLEGAVSAGFDRDGRPAFLVTSSRDITERTRLEERLRQSEKLEAIGSLAGGVAHDFNNLLTVINGYSDSALGQLGDRDETLRDYIAEIRRAGGRAADLTRQLLAFSRQQALRPEPVDLNEVIATSETFLRRLLGEDVTILFELAGELVPAVADQSQLVQVVLNLSVNARDAMPNGGELSIRTGVSEVNHHRADLLGIEPGSYVTLAVADTGDGIDPEFRSRIFEPFFTTKESGKGTGLGLSTVHGIARQLGGGISCESRLGSGTTFTVYLPASDERPRSSESEAQTPRGGSERILLVEDEAVLRDVVGLMLTQLGYGFEVAASPNDALTLIRSGERFDLLLTDVVMPEMNGHELARRVEELSPSIQVVYTSGYTGDVVLGRGVLADREAFLQKPFTVAELDTQIRTALSAD
ncbi:MAG TPA: PAS domain S-box protein [Microbacteriaceae bacterium]|nr:PAS domain S-box protein [Microbacteriaceae bacterium]